MVTLQLGCVKASHRLLTPVSVIGLLPRRSVVTLQLGCFKASHRLETSVSVIAPSLRSSVVTLQLGCFKASHRLVTPVSVVIILAFIHNFVNLLRTNPLIQSTYSPVSGRRTNLSPVVGQRSFSSDLQIRFNPDSVNRGEFTILNLLTVQDCSYL